MKRIAFIGAGNMGGAIIRAVAKAITPEQIVIYDHHEEKTKILSEETGCDVAASDVTAASDAEYVVLAIKPQSWRDTLKALVPTLHKNQDRGQRQTLVSIVAGVSLGAIKGLLQEGGVELPVIRVMPNTPAAVGKGLFLMAPDPSVTEENYNVLCDLLSKAGSLARMSEKQLDIATPVSGCTPAYVYMFIGALADGAVQIGVPRDKAIRFAAEAVLGSAAMVLETTQHPEVLKDAVCSPAGSTIAGVEKLEEYNFRFAVAQAIVAAYRKNCELG